MGEDERREAAIASAASLQPDFTPKSNKITPSQLSKFHELHKRRLKIKEKSKTKTKIKGLEGNGSNAKQHIGKVSAATETGQGSSVPFSKGGREENPGVKEGAAAYPVSGAKRQKKLHWGLDTKERWEMKANM